MPGSARSVLAGERVNSIQNAAASEWAQGEAALEIRRVAPLQDSQWDSRLDRFPDSTCFHTRAWLRVLEHTYGHATIGFVAQAGDKVCAMIPVVVARSPWLGSRAGCVAFADLAPPLALDARSFQSIHDAVVDHGTACGWRYVEYRGGRRWLPDAPSGTEFWEHTLDLTPGEKQLFADLDTTTRRNVRKAEREGVRVEISASKTAIEQYYALHCETRKRQGSPPQPLRFFEAIHEHFVSSGRGFIALASIQQLPVAGVVILTHANRTAVYKFGAADLRYRHLRAGHLAMWEAIRYAATLGIRNYHFGRTSRHDAGLRRYKLGWACAENDLEYFCMDLRSRCFVQRMDRAGGWASQIIRRLPIPVVRQIGRVLYPHLM